ncbi:MAG: hypothetical protein HYS23_01545 [Geobacter sp.]|nr:hypothetical protein [Geobacter sp.]
MKKMFLAILILGTLSLFSGCAVIDFLDGKHLDHNRGYDQPQYGGGSSGGHSGHSH